MPMKNISTPVNPTLSLKESHRQKPSIRTLDFVRQFARVYQATRLNVVNGLPRVVLN